MGWPFGVSKITNKFPFPNPSCNRCIPELLIIIPETLSGRSNCFPISIFTKSFERCFSSFLDATQIEWTRLGSDPGAWNQRFMKRFGHAFHRRVYFIRSVHFGDRFQDFLDAQFLQRFSQCSAIFLWKKSTFSCRHQVLQILWTDLLGRSVFSYLPLLDHSEFFYQNNHKRYDGHQTELIYNGESQSMGGNHKAGYAFVDWSGAPENAEHHPGFQTKKYYSDSKSVFFSFQVCVYSSNFTDQELCQHNLKYCLQIRSSTL